jgi:hypothetical protein
MRPEGKMRSNYLEELKFKISSEFAAARGETIEPSLEERRHQEEEWKKKAATYADKLIASAMRQLPPAPRRKA